MTSNKHKWFDTPNSGLGYAAKFYYNVFKSLRTDESMALTSQLPPMQTSWHLDKKKYQQWLELMDYQSTLAQPFTISAPAGVWALMQVLNEIGISFGRIMHMSSSLHMVNPIGFQLNNHYATYVYYQGVKAHSKRAVLIRFLSVIKNVTGQEIMQLEDELYVAGLDEEFVEQLNLTSETTNRKASKSQLVNNTMADRLPLSIARNMGQRYGKLSGDLNPLHISSIGARLFGHKSSFIQGLCTLNLVVSKLGQHWKSTIGHVEIDFIRPVPQPAQLQLLCTLDSFEIIDSSNTLLVAGKYSCRS